MKQVDKKTILKHISKDSKEFKAQLKEDEKLKKQLTTSRSKKK